MAQDTNTAQVDFPTPTGNWATATHGSIWDDTTFIGSSPLNANITAVSGSPVFIPAGELVIELPDGEIVGARADAGLTAIRGTGPIRIGLHTGSPGANGTANELTGNAYARAEVAVSGLTRS